MHRFKLLFILVLFALCTVQAFAAENRFPRDYYIYLDYSKSIIPSPNPTTDQRRPNEVLSEQLLALLNDQQGQLVGAEDTVTIYRFGEDIRELSQSPPGDMAWQSTLQNFGTETEEGERLTDLQAMLESIRGHINQTMQTNQRRAKVFLIASDYIHDDMQGIDLCGVTGRGEYPDDQANQVQDEIADAIAKLPNQFTTADGKYIMPIAFGLPYFETANPFGQNPENSSNQCFNQLIKHQNNAIVSAFESRFDTERLIFTKETTQSFVDKMQGRLAKALRLPLRACIDNNEQGKWLDKGMDGAGIEVAFRNDGVEGRRIRYFRLWRPGANQPMGEPIPVPPSDRLIAPEQNRTFTFDLPTELFQALYTQSSFQVEAVEEGTDEEASGSRCTVQPPGAQPLEIISQSWQMPVSLQEPVRVINALNPSPIPAAVPQLTLQSQAERPIVLTAQISRTEPKTGLLQPGETRQLRFPLPFSRLGGPGAEISQVLGEQSLDNLQLPGMPLTACSMLYKVFTRWIPAIASAWMGQAGMYGRTFSGAICCPCWTNCLPRHRALRRVWVVNTH